jgi:hypothetical protein
MRAGTIQFRAILGISACTLPFGFDAGIAPISYILSAIITGLLWAQLTYLHWCNSNWIISLMSGAVVIYGSILSSEYALPDSVTGYGIQWFFVLLVSTNLLLFTLRSKIKELSTNDNE